MTPTPPPRDADSVMVPRDLALELEGVIIDVERGPGFDAVCLRTIKRVRDALLTTPPAPKTRTSYADGMIVEVEDATPPAPDALQLAEMPARIKEVMRLTDNGKLVLSGKGYVLLENIQREIGDIAHALPSGAAVQGETDLAKAVRHHAIRCGIGNDELNNESLPLVVGDMADAILAATPLAKSDDCRCLACQPRQLDMVLCPTCGNKRCPKANNHANACTNSNASGQPGSAYP